MCQLQPHTWLAWRGETTRWMAQPSMLLAAHYSVAPSDGVDPKRSEHSGVGRLEATAAKA
jgi:hypothetical protein